MTIQTQTSRMGYTGDGVTTAFAVQFFFSANSDIAVSFQDLAGVVTTKLLGTDYNLTGAGISTGGTCTFVVAPTTGFLIAITRVPPLTQTTSYNNNDPFPAKSHEAALDKLTTEAQYLKSLIDRTMLVAPTDTPPMTNLPPAAVRALKTLSFDSLGNPTVTVPATGAAVSAPMIPVVTASTLAIARASLGLNLNLRLAKTAAYQAANADRLKTIALGGSAFYALTFIAASNYDADFMVLVLNEDTTRGKTIACNGLASFILWPGQSCTIFNQNNVWKVNPSFQRWSPGRNVTFFVDTAGSDSNDGLATGAGALRNIQTAINMTEYFVDWGGTNSGSQGTISPTAGQTFTETVAVSGGQVGGNEIFIHGNGGAFTWANSGQNSMLSVGDGGICIIQDINFLSSANTFGKAPIYLHNNGIIDINSGITVQGGGANDIAIFLDNHGCICTLANGMVVTNTFKALIWCDNGGKVSLSGVLSPTGATQVSQLFQAQYRSVIIVGTQPATSGWGSIGTSNAIKGGLLDTNGTTISGGTSSSTGGLVL
jgi:hypothetical protein